MSFIGGISESQKNQFKISVLLTGSIAFVLGLAWNNAITSIIDQYYPEKNKNAWYKLLYAIVLTIAFTIILNLVY